MSSREANGERLCELVDPFIGCEATRLPEPQGIARSWYWLKAEVGNTHPGACFPLGMVSVCPYSGAYPTGYGLYEKSTTGQPERMFDSYTATGFTHFHQSGTGAIGSYYNYLRVRPLVAGVSDSGFTGGVDVTGPTSGTEIPGTQQRGFLCDEVARPGYYAAKLCEARVHQGNRRDIGTGEFGADHARYEGGGGQPDHTCRDDSAVDAELTVSAKSAVHRYTYPPNSRPRVFIDVSGGGILADNGERRSAKTWIRITGDARVYGMTQMEGINLYFCAEATASTGVDGGGAAASREFRGRSIRGLLCKDGSHGGDDLGILLESEEQPTGRESRREWSDADKGREDFGADSGDERDASCRPCMQLKIAFSLRSVEQAAEHLERTGDFDEVVRSTQAVWEAYLGRLRVRGGSVEQRRVFYTALYHSLIKPADFHKESPYWDDDACFLDFSTLWDMYKTQLPLIFAVYPERGGDIINSLLNTAVYRHAFPNRSLLNDAEPEGNSDKQAAALAHTVICDALGKGIEGVDRRRARDIMLKGLLVDKGAEFIESGKVYPPTHTLDLAYACFCTGEVAGSVGDQRIRTLMMRWASRWDRVYDRESGVLIPGEYYEGNKWNYSFRILHDMRGRVALSGGNQAFVKTLDRFFGYAAAPTGDPDFTTFEGLHNEPDMETPFAYIFAGRHDRTCEVVRTVMSCRFATGRGGLPGNDDSGGTSSWYVWNAIGLFPVAGRDILLVGSPVFESVTVVLAHGEFHIEAPGVSEQNIYVQAAYLNGRPIDRAFLRWEEIAGGARLLLEMGATPSRWASEVLPPDGDRNG